MSAKAWTDAEKLALLSQIVEKLGTVPWDNLVLPPGRTKKACTVMVDRERQKARKMTADEEGGEGSESNKGTKRKATSEEPGKKKKTPRKNLKSLQTATNDDDDEEDVMPGQGSAGGAEELVKEEGDGHF